MNTLRARSFSCLIVSAASFIGWSAPHPLMAQELSEASFIGSLEGAADACAAAYPVDAGTYRETLSRLVGCHFTAEEFRRWHEHMRNNSPERDQYSMGWRLGRSSLSDYPNARREQCMSLARLTCDANTNPRPRLHGPEAPERK